MLFLVSLAWADDMTGQCVDVTDPHNAVGFADREWGVADAAARIESLITPCWSELDEVACVPDSAFEQCREVSGTCADGTVILGRQQLVETSEAAYYPFGPSSSQEGAWEVEVQPDPATGLAWSALSVTKTWSTSWSASFSGMATYTRSSDAWVVEAVGAVDTALPAGGRLELARFADLETYMGANYGHTTESWNDSVCPWEATIEQGSTWNWWSVSTGGHSLIIEGNASCGADFYAPQAVLDSISLGPVIAWDDWSLVYLGPPVDTDGDGYGSGYDCNDADPTVYPCATEREETPGDDNCDGGAGVSDPPEVDPWEHPKEYPDPTVVRVDTGGSAETGGDTAADTAPSGTGRTLPDDTADTTAQQTSGGGCSVMKAPGFGAMALAGWVIAARRAPRRKSRGAPDA